MKISLFSFQTEFCSSPDQSGSVQSREAALLAHSRVSLPLLVIVAERTVTRPWDVSGLDVLRLLRSV